MCLSFLAIIVQPLTGIMRSRSSRIVVVPTINKNNVTVTIDPFFLASTSTKSFLGSLALKGPILAAIIITFTIMKRYFGFIYEPRSSPFFGACVFRRLLPWDALILI